MPAITDRGDTWLRFLQRFTKRRHVAVSMMGERPSSLTGARPTPLRSFTRQCGGYLALVALAVQLALSFGHLHARDISASGIVFAKASAADGWQRPASAEVSKPSPSKLADDEDLCPVCFSGFLLSTSFVPDAPQPPVSFAFEPIDLLFARTIALVAAIRRAPFQPRAPPLA
jgi:Protein of unknown function (DUF2946)